MDIRKVFLVILLFSGIIFGQREIFTTSRIWVSQDTVTSTTIDWSLGNAFTKGITTGAVSISFTNTVNGQQITVAIYNSSTATLSWTCSGATIYWPDRTVPTQTTGGKTDVYSFVRVGNKMYGTVIQNF